MVPPDTPVTIPELLTDAMAVELLFQLPGAPIESLSAVVLPSQTSLIPVIGAGSGLTVAVVVS